jgi:outer membrane receptor protein involved in Fe transport
MNHRFKNHWILNTGYELYTDKVTSIRQKTDFTTGVISDLRGLYPNGSGLFQHGIYTMVKGEWNAAQITLGSRLQSTQTTIPDITLGRVRDNNRALVNTLGVSSALGKKGSVWGNSVRVYGNFSSTFRAPNIDDMGTLGIVDFRYEVPQFNLRPEYSNNHEIGLKLNANKLKFQVSYYQNYLYNVIARVRKGQDSINGYPVFQKENIERAIVQGLEFYTEISLGKSMFIKAGYATMRGDNLTKNEPMRRIPPSNGLVQWNYLWGKEKSNRVFIKYSAAAAQRKLASGDISDNRIGKNGTPGYLQLDIGMQFLWKDIRIATTMQNLSNEYIKVHGSGVALPGRSINLVIEF